MPLRLNIGWSKKIGQPDFGSLGASAHLELELDSGAVSDTDRLRQHVRHLFGLAKTSVEEELNRQQPPLPRASRNGLGRDQQTRDNGRVTARGHQILQRSNGRVATQSQVRALKAIASRHQIDLGARLERYGVRTVEELGVHEASRMIDDLNAQPAGNP